MKKTPLSLSLMLAMLFTLTAMTATAGTPQRLKKETRRGTKIIYAEVTGFSFGPQGTRTAILQTSCNHEKVEIVISQEQELQLIPGLEYTLEIEAKRLGQHFYPSSGLPIPQLLFCKELLDEAPCF